MDWQDILWYSKVLLAWVSSCLKKSLQIRNLYGSRPVLVLWVCVYGGFTVVFFLQDWTVCSSYEQYFCFSLYRIEQHVVTFVFLFAGLNSMLLLLFFFLQDWTECISWGRLCISAEKRHAKWNKYFAFSLFIFVIVIIRVLLPVVRISLNT